MQRPIIDDCRVVLVGNKQPSIHVQSHLSQVTINNCEIITFISRLRPSPCQRHIGWSVPTTVFCQCWKIIPAETSSTDVLFHHLQFCIQSVLGRRTFRLPPEGTRRSQPQQGHQLTFSRALTPAQSSFMDDVL